MKNKKLLYVASNMEHINNFHRDYIDAFRREGFRVDVMARGEGADFNVPFEKKLFSRQNGKCRKQIRRIIKDGDYGAIILHTSLAAFHVRFACPRKNRPRIVNVVHGYLFSKDVNKIKAALLLLCEKITRGKTDAVVTMNGCDLEIAKKHRLSRGRVYFCRGFGAEVRQSVSSPREIRQELFGDSDFVLTFVGELSARKNQQFLIGAVKELRPKIPKIKLCLVGDGDRRTALEALAKELQIDGCVVFTGRRADACDIVRGSDLYVSSSMIEGMPFNVIEALGAEKTVLISRIKGHTDLVDPGVDGFLYDFGDTASFVSLALEIYEGKATLQRENIRKKYEKYEKSSVFPETFAIMKEAIE